jgi:hypothetical protein
MRSCEFLYCTNVFVALDGWSNVETGAANANCLTETPLKTWFNLIQGG